MPIKIIAKGPVKNVQRSAHRRGISLKSCRASKERFSQVYCAAPCSKGNQVRRWFGDAMELAKGGRGYPPGTLLFFNESCGALEGARKRKKR